MPVEHPLVAFVAADTNEARNAQVRLAHRYGNTPLDRAEVVVALGGDGCSRSAVGGGRRAPFCGMGACQECRVSIDGRRRLACQTVCQSGMRVETQA